MRARRILNAALGLFVLAALALIARQAMTGGAPAPAPPAPTSVVASVVPHPALPAEPEAESTTPAPSSEAPPDAASGASAEPAAPAPRAARVTNPPRIEKVAAARPAEKAAAEKPAVVTPPHKVVAMYFHGDIRCVTCRKVEAYAKEAVESGFPENVAKGDVEFRAVNVDQPENRHFVQDYQLTNKSVVVVDEVAGSVVRWVKLDNVWGLVGNRDAYLLYVQDAVRAYVEN